ncbi:MAG: hypothetical protein AAFR51_09805 [Pseudomonadota bacterium]
MQLRSILLGFTGCLAIVAGALAYDPYERRSCIAAGNNSTQTKPKGYEFVDLGRRQVWGTSNWTDQEFNAFNLPWHKPLYFKNDPRVGYADQARILRSPGCETDGEFNTLSAFGQEFRHVVQLTSFNRIDRGDKQLLVTRLVKYHELTYHAGREVRVLHAPDGQQYIAVARTANRSLKGITLPVGWWIDSYRLEEDFDLNLSGEITNIRTRNKDSFQGPLHEIDQFPRSPSVQD